MKKKELKKEIRKYMNTSTDSNILYFLLFKVVSKISLYFIIGFSIYTIIKDVSLLNYLLAITGAIITYISSRVYYHRVFKIITFTVMKKNGWLK